MFEKPEFSIILCTANRKEPLRACLENILLQSIPPEQYEIIVINNVPEDDVRVRSVIHDLGASEKIRYSFEEEEGLSPARNHGITLAKADILVFIDDDALAEPTWLEELLKTYCEHPDAAVVGGKIRLFWEGDVPGWLHPALYGYLGELDYGEGVFPIQTNQRLGGGNFSIEKSWLEKCGGFSHQLGRNHKSLLSGEETELFIRVWDQGGQCYYNSEAIVMHPAPLHRMNKQFFRQRVYWGARSEARIDRIHFPQQIALKIFSKLIRLPYHLSFSAWYGITNQPAFSFLWETFYLNTLGYIREFLCNGK
ncbi:glycosyltransferase family 2 protein [Candidatus Parcubacteria bacterium]|jgi:GT2 family glycosyltransferase|nr:MAG: glycosyltransferase family 2 protein [Candidatus Parcubacteria bacterium]